MTFGLIYNKQGSDNIAQFKHVQIKRSLSLFFPFVLDGEMFGWRLKRSSTAMTVTKPGVQTMVQLNLIWKKKLFKECRYQCKSVCQIFNCMCFWLSRGNKYNLTDCISVMEKWMISKCNNFCRFFRAGFMKFWVSWIFIGQFVTNMHWDIL